MRSPRGHHSHPHQSEQCAAHCSVLLQSALSFGKDRVKVVRCDWKVDVTRLYLGKSGRREKVKNAHWLGAHVLGLPYFG